MGKYVIKQASNGVKFDLKAVNGQIILSSQVYKSEASCLKGVHSIKNNAPIAGVEDQTKSSIIKEKNPKFELYKDKGGQFRFRLKAKNGEIIGVSEGYKTKGNCLKGIRSVISNSATEVISNNI